MLVRNRNKSIRKESIPTVKLLLCIPDIDTADLCPTILVILTSCIRKACATLRTLFLPSKGKASSSQVTCVKTQAHTKPHQQHIHHVYKRLLVLSLRRSGTATGHITCCDGCCDEWPYAGDTFESGYKPPVSRSLHLSSQAYLWWIWYQRGLAGKMHATLCAAAATKRSLHCCLILATRNYKNICNKYSCS